MPPARVRSVANARHPAHTAPDGHRSAAGSQRFPPARRRYFQQLHQHGRAFHVRAVDGMDFGRDCRASHGLRKSENGITASPHEYGSMNATARELVASFDLEKL